MSSRISQKIRKRIIHSRKKENLFIKNIRKELADLGDVKKAFSFEKLEKKNFPPLDFEKE